MAAIKHRITTTEQRTPTTSRQPTTITIIEEFEEYEEPFGCNYQGNFYQSNEEIFNDDCTIILCKDREVVYEDKLCNLQTKTVSLVKKENVPLEEQKKGGKIK